MFVSGFVDRWQFTEGHVAGVPLGHVAKRSSDDDGSVACPVHGFNPVEPAARSRYGTGPRAVFIQPAQEEINAKTGVVAGKSNHIAVEFDVLLKQASDQHAAVRERDHGADPFVTGAACTRQPAADVLRLTHPWLG